MPRTRRGLLTLEGFSTVPPGYTPIANPCVTTTHCLGPFQGNIDDFIDERHEIKAMPRIHQCHKLGAKGATVVGPIAAPPLVMSTCMCNAVHAAAKRHLAEREDPTPFMQLSMHYEVERVRDRLTAAYWRWRAQVSWDYWLHRYPGWKQQAILRAVLTEHNDDPTVVTSMVKREVLVGLDSDGITLSPKVPKKARLIHFYRYLSAQERHAMRYYCYQKAVAEVFDGSQGTADDDIRVTVASAMNQRAKGQWMDDAMSWVAGGENPTVYERDGASWDATMGEAHMDLQLSGMRDMEPALVRTVDATRICKVKFRVHASPRTSCDFIERFAYQLDHTTKSGHNDTSSRNSFINAIVTQTALRFVGVTAARVLVIGDDMWCLMRNRPDLAALLDAERDCGIKPEAALFDATKFCRTEFASDVFAPSDDGTIAIPKLGKLFAKLYATTNAVRPAESAAFAHSIAVGLSDLLLEAPLYGDFLRCALDETYQLKLVSTGRWKREVDKRIHYGPEFKVWLFERYGITSCQLVELTSFLATCRGPGVMKHPLIDAIMAVDLADPSARC